MPKNLQFKKLAFGTSFGYRDGVMDLHNCYSFVFVRTVVWEKAKCDRVEINTSFVVTLFFSVPATSSGVFVYGFQKRHVDRHRNPSSCDIFSFPLLSCFPKFSLFFHKDVVGEIPYHLEQWHAGKRSKNVSPARLIPPRSLRYLVSICTLTSSASMLQRILCATNVGHSFASTATLIPIRIKFNLPGVVVK